MSTDFFPGSLADVSVVCGGVLRCLQLLCFQQGPFQATPTLLADDSSEWKLGWGGTP